MVREDLQRFQERLAQRMQVAQTQETVASWLAVAVDGMHCLFPLAHANEVLPASPIQPVAYAKPWFLGVISARGRIYGVVHLAAYIAEALQQAPLQRAQHPTQAPYSLIALHAETGLQCALLVNAVLGLRNKPMFTQTVAAASGAPQYFGAVYTDTTQTQWQEIDLLTLARSAEFLSITA